MALMERVATLLRANLNDLLERAEDPEKMLRQLVLDMENQLLQLKTQVAIALADQHLLEKKAADQEQTAASWHRRAELAVSKGEDGLARAALERALHHEATLEAFRSQVSAQAADAEALRGTYTKLLGKLAETKAHCEVLIAQHRRARLVARAAETRFAATGSGDTGSDPIQTFDLVKSRVDANGARAQAASETASIDDRFAVLEQDERVEQLLADLKSKQQRLLPTG